MTTNSVSVTIALAFALVVTACSSNNEASAPPSTAEDAGKTTSTAAPGGLALEALSTDASRVTGGDVLLAIDGSPEMLTFTVDGTELDARDLRSDAKTQRVVVSGLPEGESTLEVTDGTKTGELEVVNYPISGPVFSGDHVPMPTCTTQNFGLGEATDADCFAESQSTVRYISADGDLTDLDEGETAPDDAFRRGDGTQPEIEPVKDALLIDVDTGVINRGIYNIYRAQDVEWNGRLIYRFGGGCGTTYSQGFDLMSDPDPALLDEGYAIATSTLTTFQVACNDVLSAETAMMVKEYFAETYGLPEVTIGEGGSGGAIQQFLIAQNYPGILDALAVTSPFPDAISISGGVLDCALLNRYYGEGGTKWSDVQRTATNGHQTSRTCSVWDQTFVPGVDPSKCGFGDAIAGMTAALPGLGGAPFPQPPEDLIFDAETNPDGIRCTLQDSAIAVYGTDPETGFARRAWDNTGIQYGLQAVNDGEISVDQFLDLNANIGSHDINGQWQKDRADASLESLEVSYRTGRVNQGLGDLDRIPIVLVNYYADDQGDIHDRFRLFSILDRLSNGGVQPANVAFWTRALPQGTSLIDSLTGDVQLGPKLIHTVDDWATAMMDAAVGDDSSLELDAPTIAERFLDTSGTEAVNACFEADGTMIESGDDIYEGDGPCTDPFPMSGDPRTVAGEPIAQDILKCELMDIDEAFEAEIYDIDFTKAQLESLNEVFPNGVCDWNEPSVGAVPFDGPWQSFN